MTPLATEPGRACYQRPSPASLGRRSASTPPWGSGPARPSLCFPGCPPSAGLRGVPVDAESGKACLSTRKRWNPSSLSGVKVSSWPLARLGLPQTPALRNSSDHGHLHRAGPAWLLCSLESQHVATSHAAADARSPPQVLYSSTFAGRAKLPMCSLEWSTNRQVTSKIPVSEKNEKTLSILEPSSDAH